MINPWMRTSIERLLWINLDLLLEIQYLPYRTKGKFKNPYMDSLAFSIGDKNIQNVIFHKETIELLVVKVHLIEKIRLLRFFKKNWILVFKICL